MKEREWRVEDTLSVEEAMGEAINTPMDLPTPEPHLPLRRASARDKRTTPKPLWTPSQDEVRGFNPSPVRAMPQMDNATASSEHAFAGREDSRKRPFKPPLGVQAMRQAQTDSRPSSSQVSVSSRPPSSSVLSPTSSYTTVDRQRSLRSTKSVGEGLRGWKNRLSSPYRGRRKYEGEMRSSVPIRPTVPGSEVRDSFRSAVTSNRSAVTSSASFLNTSSFNTPHSSMTGNSSHSDFVEVYPDWRDTPEEHEDEDADPNMTVEDAIGMYVDGFDSSARPSVDTMQQKRSLQQRRSLQGSPRPFSQPSDPPSEPKRRQLLHRRSQSAGLLQKAQTLDLGSLTTAKSATSNHKHTFSRILSTQNKSPMVNGTSSSEQTSGGVPRDRYGFKKASNYISVAAYDAWNVQYTQHLERRRRKWHNLMKSYGLSTDKPFRFPPKSDKIKRYVRKGIPPEFRGAAWYWYAGGPGKLAKEPGLYEALLERVKNGELADADREHIERDLHRTFPDNLRFKPDPTATLDVQADAGGGEKKHKRQKTDPETPMLQALRRLLQAFAVHNPTIGYCQSLNFIAGLLLLFLDQDEEKSFTLLNIVTTTHLPGTHGIALEGANIDIAVLMSCIKDALPAIWSKLDDKGGSAPFPAAQALRLPTVSLATTAWFMSLFVGTLPIESVLRVWDCLFFEGSKTLFRIALAIFKFGSPQILAVSDPMEIFQVVQTTPRGMLDINTLMEICFRRRGGFGHVSQDLIERRREERREAVRAGVASVNEEKRSWRGRWRVMTKV